jgi:L,D-transpeptidase catalytic domain
MAETWAARGGWDAAPVDLCVTSPDAGHCRLRPGGCTQPGVPASRAVPGGRGKRGIGRLRVEVNLKDQVLVLYRHNHVALVSHVSTGGGRYFCSPNGCGNAITPTGDFTTLSFLPGRVTVPLGEMYNPVFFIGTTFAIHGDTHVPRRPASHGCVRIPIHIAAFFHTLVPTPGTPVYIRG